MYGSHVPFSSILTPIANKEVFLQQNGTLRRSNVTNISLMVSLHKGCQIEGVSVFSPPNIDHAYDSVSLMNNLKKKKKKNAEDSCTTLGYPLEVKAQIKYLCSINLDIPT
jgi:hypothetical protein